MLAERQADEEGGNMQVLPWEFQINCMIYFYFYFFFKATGKENLIRKMPEFKPATFYIGDDDFSKLLQ